MRKVVAYAGYGNMIATPPHGAMAEVRASVYESEDVMLNAEDLVRAFNEFIENGNKPENFWVIIRKLKYSALEKLTSSSPNNVKDGEKS